jgi:hypothetical protein
VTATMETDLRDPATHGSDLCGQQADPVDGWERAHRSPVVVEVVYLRADRAGGWRYRQETGPLPERTDPQQAARRIAGLDDPGRAQSVLHSTSWRYHEAGHIVLTYALVPDPDPGAPSAALVSLDIARGSHRGHPAPAIIDPVHVAAHAVRHLALLAETDPVVAAAIGEHESLAAALADHEHGPAGQLT